jgi:putative ABC transport system permease protein
LEIFDRTFLITGVLRLLAVAVAFVGVLSALLAMLMERSREFAILRANGVTPREILYLLSLETGFLGLTAGVLAIPTGLLLAAVLVHVINQRAFGWTMSLTIEPLVLFQALGLATVAALIAGLYPAWRAARSHPAASLRIE